MPTYEFRCPQGHDFEKLYRTISGAETSAECPSCGQLAGRIMSAAGFAFKGSGFYLTDYGKDAHRGKPPEVKGGGADAQGGESESKAERSRSDGASTDAGKSEGAKSDSGKSEGAKADAPSASKQESAGSATAAKPPAKPADSKPAPAPSKPSKGE